MKFYYLPSAAIHDFPIKSNCSQNFELFSSELLISFRITGYFLSFNVVIMQGSDKTILAQQSKYTLQLLKCHITLWSQKLINFRQKLKKITQKETFKTFPSIKPILMIIRKMCKQSPIALSSVAFEKGVTWLEKLVAPNVNCAKNVRAEAAKSF